MNFGEVRSLLVNMSAEQGGGAEAALRQMTTSELATLFEEFRLESEAETPGHAFDGWKDILPMIPAVLGVVKALVEWSTARHKSEASRNRLQELLVSSGVAPQEAEAIASKHYESVKRIALSTERRA